MERKDIFTVVVFILVIFTIGMIVGMSMRILGVNTFEDQDRSKIEGGAMPCMKVEVYELQTGEEEVQEAVRNYARRDSAEYSASVYARIDKKIAGASIGIDTENNGYCADRNSDDSRITEGEVNEQETVKKTEEETETDGRVDSDNKCNESVGVAEVDEDISQSEVAAVFPHYSVNGSALNNYLQEYLYQRLKYPEVYAMCLCQLYQESRYNAKAEAPNGLDKGIAQIRITHWNDLMKESGLYEGDILNPIDNLYVYTHLINKYMDQTGGNFTAALRLYFNSGNPAADEKYVQDVMQWTTTVNQI